jgi:phage gp36-like protein
MSLNHYVSGIHSLMCALLTSITEIERYIRTVKDQSRSAYWMLPFKYIPRILLIHLIKNAVFWLNTFPHEDSASQKYSPRYIMIGQQLSFKRHAAIEFGAYVQTHEEHSNDMQQRTMGVFVWDRPGTVRGHIGSCH